MKKIILLVVTILMAGIFVGCASTSNIANTSKTLNSNNKNKIFTGVYDENISDIYDDVYWVKSTQRWPIRIDDMKVYKLRKSSDPDRNIRLQNTFNKIINSTEISGRDFYKLIGCEKFMKEQLAAGAKDPFFTLEDFLTEKEISRIGSITGKIKNDTDKTLHMALHTRRQEQRHFYFEIPPHEEKYFKITRITELKESLFAVENVGKALIAWIGISSPDLYQADGPTDIDGMNIDLLEDLAKYIFDNYSFEMTINENTSNNYPDNIDDWKLVPRYETEENVLTDALDYNGIQTVLSKYR